jgi:hypothetical protein
MAPAHSKLTKNESKKRLGQALEHSMSKISKGTAVFSDEFVNAMAEGKPVPLPKNLDDVVVDIDSEEEDDKNSDKENGNKSLRCTKKLKTYKSSLDVEDIEPCPKYARRGPFAVWEDASYYSDGELKHFNIKCQETESSPCSFCTGDSGDDNYVKTPSPKGKGSEFAQAKGFDINDYEGEEATPNKRSANSCKWCMWDPCVMNNDEVNEEAKVIVDNLIAQEKQGIEVSYKSYRYALYRYYARVFKYKERELLPVCVQSFIDENFVEEGEERTGFISSEKV